MTAVLLGLACVAWFLAGFLVRPLWDRRRAPTPPSVAIAAAPPSVAERRFSAAFRRRSGGAA